MREIKFKGVSIYELKTVIYGYYFYDKINDRHYILNEDLVRCEVVQESVGQYTGLKDKNGKEIYEGDIV